MGNSSMYGINYPSSIALPWILLLKNPSCLHAVSASSLPKENLLHTVPHKLLQYTSSLPSDIL